MQKYIHIRKECIIPVYWFLCYDFIAYYLRIKAVASHFHETHTKPFTHDIDFLICTFDLTVYKIESIQICFFTWVFNTKRFHSNLNQCSI